MKIGIVSDIHEDAVNLEKALIALEKQNCDKVVCLGDIIGFSYPNFGFFDTRNAGRCIDLIKANCAVTVVGNHDLYTVRRVPMHNAGFNYPPYWFQLGLLNYGMSTGTTATGFVLLRVVDPQLRSGAAEVYALASPLSSPFVGGGMITLALPMIVAGSSSPAIPCLVLSVALLALFAAGFWLRTGQSTGPNHEPNQGPNRGPNQR